MKNRVAILTDTNSGLCDDAKDYGVYIIKMPVIIDGEVYIEGENLTREEFNEKMEAGAEITTSMPPMGDLIDLFDKLLEEYEEIVYIPMSSALSGSYEAARMMAEEYEGKVFVVDNKRISVTMKQSVIDAKNMADDGMSGKEILEYLENDALNTTIYISVDTLKYLKKGGRITPAGALIADAFSIKPVLQIQGGKLDSFAIARGIKGAIKSALGGIDVDIESRFKGQNYKICAVCSGDVRDSWETAVREHFDDETIVVDYLPLSITAHVGLGAMGIALSVPYEKKKI